MLEKTKIKRVALALFLYCMILVYLSGCIAPPVEKASPVAQISATPTTVKLGESITFSATDSTDPDGNIISYEWHFGDGNTVSGATVNHDYSDKGGTYNIKLTVTDDDGLSGTAEVSVNIMIGITIKIEATSSTWRKEEKPYNIYIAVKSKLEEVGFEGFPEESSTYDATLVVTYKEEKGGYYSSIDAYGTMISCSLWLYDDEQTLFEETIYASTLWFFTSYGEPSEFTLYSKVLSNLANKRLYFKYLGLFIATKYYIGDELSVMITVLHDEDLRVEAAKALSNMGEKAVEPLIAALKDEDACVRFLAAGALGDIGDERAVEPLIAALSDEHSYVREYAAEALGKIGDERAIEPLTAALNDEEEDVRMKATEALEKIQKK